MHLCKYFINSGLKKRVIKTTLIAIFYLIVFINQIFAVNINSNNQYTPRQAQNLFSQIIDSNVAITDTLAVLLKQTQKYILTNNIEQYKPDLYLSLGKYYLKTQKYDTSKLYLDTAYYYLKKTNNSNRLAHFYYNLSIVKYRTADYNLSHQLLKKSLELAENSEPGKLLISIYLQLSVLVREKGELNQSIVYNQLALEQSILLNDIKSEAGVYNNFGITYLSLKNYPLAAENFTKANKIFRKLNNINGLIISNINLGLINERTNNPDSALFYYQKALNLSHNNNVSQYLCSIYNNIGIIQQKEGNYTDALQYFLTSLKIRQTNNDQRGQVTVLHSLGDLHFEMGNMPKAIDYFTKSYNIATTIGWNEILPKIYESLALYYSKTKNYPEAYKYETLLRKNNEKVFTQQITEQIAKTDEYLKTHQKEKENLKLIYENTIQEKRIKNQRIMILAVGIGIFLAVLLFIITIKANRSLTQKNIEIQKNRDKIIGQNFLLENQKKQLLELNASKDKLFSITTQNLWEPVGTIKNILTHLINTKGTDDTKTLMSFIQTSKDAAVSAYNLLENLLYWAKVQQGQLKNEPGTHDIISLLQHIIYVQQPKSTSKFIVIRLIASKQYTGYFDKTLIEIAFRNIIENAIKFSTRGGEITISVNQGNKKIIITVTDTGVGMTREQLNQIFTSSILTSTPGTHGEKGGGIGLLLSKVFVELNLGTISAVSSIAEGTKITVILPQNADNLV